MVQRKTASALALGLVLAASTYLLVLCGLYTAAAPITDTIVALVDGAIVLSALALAAWRAPRLVLTPLLVLALAFAALALFTQNIDFKSIRDVLVIVAFLSLGFAYGDAGWTQVAFLSVSALVLVFALVEFAFPTVHASTFNVLQFYIMRGELDPRVLEYTDSSLFVSGMRNQGRFLFPFIGPHRTSSIFLEPVSMGNFGAIAIAWALSLSARRWRWAITAGAIGLAAVILADARFAALIAGLFLVARFVPVAWMRLIIAPAPFAAVAMLLAFGDALRRAGDDLPTRLAQSGQAIANLDAPALLGLVTDRAATLDAGYAYTLMAFGLPLCLLAWAAFVWLPTPGSQSARFKFMLGLYICALLCVSGSSLFALKTAALAWFLLGGAIASDLTAGRNSRRAADARSTRAPEMVAST